MMPIAAKGTFGKLINIHIESNMLFAKEFTCPKNNLLF